MKKLRVAFVYDRITKIGGAERVLMAMHEIWPDAPIYTAVYDSDGATWADGIRIIPSFLQRVVFAKKHHEWFAWITPMAFETFNFDAFDVVISVTSAEAKNIITKPHTLHICYCLTPTRYLWSGYNEYSGLTSIGLPGWLVRIGFTSIVQILRSWDLIASMRPDTYIAISQLVSKRISKFYKKHVHSVIYPPVTIDDYVSAKNKNTRQLPFLLVSRLVRYKRIDIVVEAFNALGWPLVIVGDGAERNSLKNMAQKNIRFAGFVTESTLKEYYKNCRAFVFAGSEDFGIAAVEALAAGKPVIAYRNSGLTEVIQPGITGELFDVQSPESLIATLNIFNNKWYDSYFCIERAKQFSKENFKTQMKQTVETLYNSNTL